MPDLNFWNIVFIIWLIKGGNYFNHSQHTAAHMTCLDFRVLSVFWNYAYLFVSKHKKMSAHTNKHLFCLYLLVAATVIKIRNENEKRYIPTKTVTTYILLHTGLCMVPCTCWQTCHVSYLLSKYGQLSASM